jgi:glycerol kinase
MSRKTGKFVLVLDVGTTGVKSFVFDEAFNIVAKAYKHIEEIKTHSGYVEQDPSAILEIASNVMRSAVEESDVSVENILGIAITNQRESVVAWNKKTSSSLYPIISWKDVRTKKYCDQFSDTDREVVKQKTGLPIEPYFSASKINWLLNNVSDVKLAAEKRYLAFGTLDSWLIWNLGEEKNFVTDWTNASRTLLYDIKNKRWDKDLLSLFDISEELLPKVEKSRGSFGMLSQIVLGRSIPIKVVCGDQQSSLYAAGTKVGTTKITYGTGVFIMQILGDDFSLKDGFFTTLDVEGNCVLEAKVNHGGREVESLLGNDEALRSFLKKIAVEADYYIKKLPTKPEKITIDGGVMRDGIIGKYQEEISGIKISEQTIFDGTALGLAKLFFS